MNSLEDLVPPLMLCVKIPSGAFEDSALVWWGACVYPRLYPDGVRFNTLWHKKNTIPAPTFQEIMQSFDQDKAYLPNAYWIKGAWQVDIEDSLDANVKISKNLSAAALELWLELNAKKNRETGV